jgi:simple sugar transport system permease protein
VSDGLDPNRPSDAQRGAPGDPGGMGPQVREDLSWVERYGVAQKAGGLLAPVLTALLAFFIGGIVVLITTGKNPLTTYQAIFEGSGLNWLLPWVTGDDRLTASYNLQLTLLYTTPLILTGLAVAFAFRCGMFNIGGQGQYLVGAIFAVWIGSSFDGLDPFLHILFAVVVATLAGALWAGIAGLLKATVGAHEVISTIMLNWIAIWVGQFLFGLGGPLQNDLQESVPISNDIVEGAKLPVFWGDPLLQGLSIGIFVALAALVVYHFLLNRTTLGYSVRAVGFNPEAARYGGINVPRNYFLAMAISGCFAGLAGALDILGWQFRLSTSDIQTTTIGFIGIAVALLGRNTAVGVGLSALLFGALVNGTSTRNLDPEVFQPELASNLTVLIQGLVVLFVGADVIVLTIMAKLRRRPPKSTAPTPEPAAPA